MSRLILKENVNRVIQKAFDDDRISYKDGQYLMDRIAEIPDGLIRCKDCKHRKQPTDYCEKLLKAYVPDDFYCFYGERKENKNDYQQKEI